MGYKDENIKHKLGIASKPKYSCPECKKGLSISKPTFMVICSNCNTVITEDKIVKNGST